jgi:transcriptional regulator GlxA family with amidase domain
MTCDVIFIPAPAAPEHVTSLAATRKWALQRLHESLTLSDLARHAHVSVRTLTRRFSAGTGLSPLQWLLSQRIQRARELLETTGLPMDQVAGQAGVRTTDSLREHIRRTTGLTPSAYRATFPR